MDLPLAVMRSGFTQDGGKSRCFSTSFGSLSCEKRRITTLDTGQLTTKPTSKAEPKMALGKTTKLSGFGDVLFSQKQKQNEQIKLKTLEPSSLPIRINRAS